MKRPAISQSDIDWLIDSMKIVFPTKEESTKKFDAVMKKLRPSPSTFPPQCVFHGRHVSVK